MDAISLKIEGSFAVNQQDFNQSVIDMKGEFIGGAEQLATSVLDPKAVEMIMKKQAVPVWQKGLLAAPKSCCVNSFASLASFSRLAIL